jgi:hypothetical protein
VNGGGPEAVSGIMMLHGCLHVQDVNDDRG